MAKLGGFIPPAFVPAATASWSTTLGRRRSNGSHTVLRMNSSVEEEEDDDDDGAAARTDRNISRVIRASTIRQVYLFNLKFHLSPSLCFFIFLISS